MKPPALKPFAALLVMAVLVLPGCKQDAKQAKATGGTAAGEILPGSTSDAMIPVDTLRSAPPAAPKAEGGGSDKAKSKPAEASLAAEPAAAEPAPAEPAAEPEG